jgi:hypothetical protein
VQPLHSAAGSCSAKWIGGPAWFPRPRATSRTTDFSPFTLLARAIPRPTARARIHRRRPRALKYGAVLEGRPSYCCVCSFVSTPPVTWVPPLPSLVELELRPAFSGRSNIWGGCNWSAPVQSRSRYPFLLALCQHFGILEATFESGCSSCNPSNPGPNRAPGLGEGRIGANRRRSQRFASVLS